MDFVNTHLEENPTAYGNVGPFIYHLSQRKKCEIVTYCIETGYVDRLQGSLKGLPVSRKEDEDLFVELLQECTDQPRLLDVSSNQNGKPINDASLRQKIHAIKTSDLTEEQRMIELANVLESISISQSRDSQDFVMFIDELRLRVFEYLERFIGPYKPFSVYSVVFKRFTLSIHYLGDYRIMQWEQEHIDKHGRYSETPIKAEDQYGIDN